ncbi:MAG: DUF6516 family protein [Anaerolineae bacterium]
MSLVNTERLREIAEVEFANIVTEAFSSDINELRIILTDSSFVEVWFSLKLTGRYSFHWERRAIDGTIYRHDNAPHKRWQSVETFPSHFHDGSETNVAASHLSRAPEEALREFLTFVRDKLNA